MASADRVTLYDLDSQDFAGHWCGQSAFYIGKVPRKRSVLEETLAEMDVCHKAGKFKEFGLSNYPAWQVVEVCQVCKHKGWVLPTVYQGVYNALNRTAEYELVPVLRNYGT